MQTYDALILAGGQGRRLGGVDKAALLVGGETLLDRALCAVEGAERVVIVGRTASPVPFDVKVVSEEPPGGGPVAAIAAGMAFAESHVVVIVACDMPLLTSSVVATLVGRLVEPVADAPEPDDMNEPAKPGGSGGRDQGAEMPWVDGPDQDVGMPWVDGVNLIDENGHQQPLAAVYRSRALREALTRLETPAGASMRQLVSRLSMLELHAHGRATLDCDTWTDVKRCRELLNQDGREKRWA